MIFNVILGLVFALCARDRVVADGPFRAPASVILGAFIAVVLVPATFYIYVVHPAWAWMYMVDPAKISGVVLLPVVSLHAGAVIAGWWGGAKFLQRGRSEVLLYALAGLTILCLAGVVFFWERFGRYGSYDAWVNGFALPLMQVKLGYVLLAMMVAIAAAAAYTSFELIRDSRRVRARTPDPKRTAP